MRLAYFQIPFISIFDLPSVCIAEASIFAYLDLLDKLAKTLDPFGTNVEEVGLALQNLCGEFKFKISCVYVVLEVEIS